MAGTSLLALLDDIASVLDDVSLMTKVAAKKTAGVLSDDLALNAEQIAGVLAERELAVVWAVAKGSLINKLILVPAALLISAVAPWLVTVLLMIGGAYLCYEGTEKLLHKISGRKGEHEAGEEKVVRIDPEAADPAGWEKAKIRGAIRTDFVLSAEILVIALGSIPEAAPLGTRAAVLALVGALMTVGVYGLVACIVKVDDVGLHMTGKYRQGSFLYNLGQFLMNSSPGLMRFLSVAGTAAMFLVGGSILAHGIPYAYVVLKAARSLPAGPMLEILINGLVGLFGGFLVFGLLAAVRNLLFAVRKK